MPFSTGEQERMTTEPEWLPRAVRKGAYRYGAVVVARNVFARLAMNQLVLGSRDLPQPTAPLNATLTPCRGGGRWTAARPVGRGAAKSVEV